MIHVLSTSLLAGALAVDDRSSVRLMISQPICAGLLTGFALGDPGGGFLAGALIQVMFLGVIPVRGMPMPDLALGGVAASALYVLALRSINGDPGEKGLVLFLSLVSALVVALVGRALHRFWEGRSYVLTERAVRCVDAGRFRLASALHFSSVGVHFAIGFAVVGVAVLAGVPAIGGIARAVSGKWCEPLGSLP
ncbi:MAG: PTS sugar transporter subunit IIC, partial [Candidatus Krumholzibacteria bacterium]|nr:PTS sugar transporter subunit IIC [Candidatus Krumholzibacteria bacterium]